MEAEIPSRTAYRVALRRAAHQIFDEPVVFQDPLALRILGYDPDLDRDRLGGTDLRAPKRASSKSLRALLVARSKFAEETLAAAVRQGVKQYVLLGAGLDTFAYRNPYPELRVFEVDHPATQESKQQMLAANGIGVPKGCTHVAVDFEREGLAERLRESGFDARGKTMFAWLGVVPYLTEEAFLSTLQWMGESAPGSGVVLDYPLPRRMLPPEEQLALDSLSERVAAAGEPFRLFLTPEAMSAAMSAAGFRVAEDLDGAAMNARYFAGREDGLRVLGAGAHLVAARRTA